jgi:hypothetical protein
MTRQSTGLLPSDLGPDGFMAAFEDSRETLARLEVYADRLRTWQSKINLVAPATVPLVWQRHFADSAQILDLAPEGAKRWVDLGSGAGFPGLVLAIQLAGRGLERTPAIGRRLEAHQRPHPHLGTGRPQRRGQLLRLLRRPRHDHPTTLQRAGRGHDQISVVISETPL